MSDESAGLPAFTHDDGRTVHLLLAGLGNSSPGHWQREWDRLLPRTVWLQHDSWDEPEEEAWLADLDRFLADGDEPVVAVTHSLGCTLLALWMQRALDDQSQDGLAHALALRRIRAALVVAPPDTMRDDFPPEVHGFALAQAPTFPFPTTVVASHDDPYSSFARAGDFAEQVGAPLVDVGEKGHINSTSGLGEWPEGQQVFRELRERAGLGPETMHFSL